MWGFCVTDCRLLADRNYSHRFFFQSPQLTTTLDCVSGPNILQKRNHGNLVGFREQGRSKWKLFLSFTVNFFINLQFEDSSGSWLKAWWQFPVFPKSVEEVMNKPFISWVNWIRGKMWKWAWHRVHEQELKISGLLCRNKSSFICC